VECEVVEETLTVGDECELGESILRFHWLVTGTLSMLLLSSPASAARLQSWRLNSNHTQLDFKTVGGVQPKAQLIFNPTRLVIDLPGTTLDGPTVTQMVGGAIRSLHVGQFDEQTTRIVVELLPGYTLNPTQVRFRGASPSQWTVYLPTPQRVVTTPDPLERSPSTGDPRQALVVVTPDLPPRTAVDGTSNIQVSRVQVTPDGFFLRTTGSGTPEIAVNRSSDRGTVNIDLIGATVSPGLSLPRLPANYYGVQRLLLLEMPSSPPTTRITLRVNQGSPDWQATLSPSGGIVLLPSKSLSNANTQNSRTYTGATSYPRSFRSANTPPGIATIESVQLTNNGTQLRIRVDQPLTYFSSWDRLSGIYRITFNNAQLGETVREPVLNSNSPLSRLNLQQIDQSTVILLLQPATGVRIGPLNQPSVQLLSLQLQRSDTVLILPPSPNIPISPPNNPTPLIPQSPVPRGRIIVVIDPGHGGKDSGAVGIGGLEEKDIILPIGQQVATILEQNGIQAILTRDADYFVDLAPRVELTQRVHGDLFVSIHANSIDNAPQANGLEVYYFSDSSLSLAETLKRSILQSVEVKDRGVRHARFYVLRNNSIPAILIETGFVTGVEDAPRLASPAYRTQMAEAIARGILQYIKQHF